LFLFCFFLFTLVLSQEDDVLVLTNENFDLVLSENKLILVEFYAPWCGHCKKLAPEFAQAATELKGIAPIAKVDADDDNNRPLAQRFGVRGFPTLKLFRDGKAIDYEGDRSAGAIVSYMKKQALPAVIKLETIEDATQFSTAERVAVIGFFAEEATTEYTIFQDTADKLRGIYTFGAIIGHSKVNKHFEVTDDPTVVLFKQFDEGKNVFSSAEWSGLEDFISAHSIPLIDEVGPQNFRVYVDAKLPLAYIFVDLGVEGEKEKYVELVRPFAVSSRKKLNWVYIDWAKYAKHSERLGLSGKTVPALAIEDLEQGTHYAFDEKAELTAATIKPWVDSFLAGTLPSTIKSEEVPENNDGPVKVVVAKNFDEIVNDPKKDVLLEFYAPWCGHCKQLAPIYEELGSAFANIPSVVIAKIDATSNDISPKLGVRGFPTIKFFPANDKQNPIDYEGGRTKEDFIDFIHEKAAVSFSIPKDEL